jgi:transposase, IS30 family
MRERKQRQELSLQERQLLYKMHLNGLGDRVIGIALGRDHKVIGNEIKRNKPPEYLAKHYDAYERAKYAHDKAKARRKRPGNTDRLKNITIRKYAEEKVKLGWTPEIISGRLPLDRPGNTICAEAIRQWLDKEAPEFRVYLPRYGKRKKTRNGQYAYHRKKGAAKTPIHERPAEANNRERFGDWEGDTVLSKRGTSACVYTLKERSTRFVLFQGLNACTIEQAERKAVQLFAALPEQARLSLTHDNGPENHFHAQLEKTIAEFKVYFAVPYAAHQRGGVENANGYLRRTFPKGTDFSLVAQEQLFAVARSHNNRPMKCLKFQTPAEVFLAELKKHNALPPPEVLSCM